MHTTRRQSFKLLGAGLALGGLGTRALGAASDATDDGLRAHKVFTSSNSASGNEVLVLARAASGGLTGIASASTGGVGSGAGLGSQGAVTLSEDGRFLFVVNAGSHSVSALRVTGRALELVSVVDTGGLAPISVAEHDGLVYVLNSSGAGGVAGFRNEDGQLTAIGNSARPLSAAGGTNPAQVGFSTDGDALLVSERNTNLLSTWPIGADGRLGARLGTASPGATPFGFAFDRRNRLLIAEAFGGVPGGSAASSWRFDGATPRLLTATVHTTQTAACWLAVTPNGRYFYTANTGSSSVSSFRIATSGEIELIAAVAGQLGAGSVPIDAAISTDGRRLFVLARGVQSIAVFLIEPDGSLTATGVGASLPTPVVGLAAN